MKGKIISQNSAKVKIFFKIFSQQVKILFLLFFWLGGGILIFNFVSSFYQSDEIMSIEMRFFILTFSLLSPPPLLPPSKAKEFAEVTIFSKLFSDFSTKMKFFIFGQILQKKKTIELNTLFLLKNIIITNRKISNVTLNKFFSFRYHRIWKSFFKWLWMDPSDFCHRHYDLYFGNIFSYCFI